MNGHTVNGNTAATVLEEAALVRLYTSGVCTINVDVPQMKRFRQPLGRSLDNLWLAEISASHNQITASQLRSVFGAYGVQVHVLGTPGRQPLRFDAL